MDTIVLGFENADAFAQAVNWPPSGVGILLKDECVSNNDVFVLNKFIYDSNALTVAANFTPSQISNVSSNINITFGQNNTATDNNTRSGGPQPYLPDAPHVDPSFFSGLGGQLDNAYYANLNESADSLLDDESNCHFNSLSQALIYDIVDPRNYNDEEAYNNLVDSVSAQNQSDPTGRVRRMSVPSHTRNFYFENNFDVNAASGRRHRRIFRSIDAHKASIKRRGFFSSIGNFVSGAVSSVASTVSSAFNTVVDVAKTAVNTVAEVGKIVGTAIFGGTYDKSADINLNIGYDQPKEIYSQGIVQVMCQECKVQGTINLHGKFNFAKDGLSTVMKEGFVETTGRLSAKAVARVSANIVLEKSITLATIPLSPISIPGVFLLGPAATLEAGVELSLGEDLGVTFGAHIDWDRIYTKIDFKTPASSVSEGWAPTRFEPIISFSGEASATLKVYVEPKIELTLSVLNDVIKMAAGLSAECSAQVTASLGQDSCSGGVDIAPSLGVELSVYASAEAFGHDLASTDYTIYEHSFPLGSNTCIGGHSLTAAPTTAEPTAAPTTPAPTTAEPTVAPTTGEPTVIVPILDCSACCESSNINRVCGTISCYCLGPRMNEDAGGVVGYFACPEGTYYSSLCSSYGYTTQIP